MPRVLSQKFGKVDILKEGLPIYIILKAYAYFSSIYQKLVDNILVSSHFFK